MYKLLYIGKKDIKEPDILSSQISKLSGSDIRFVKELDIDSGSQHFFDIEPIALFIVEESVLGYEDFIKSIRGDELFYYLPIILVLQSDDSKNKKEYYSWGVNNFLDIDFDNEDLLLTCNLVLKNKIKLDEITKQLSSVSELNITKALQLDLLRKFIPQTVWDKTQILAEGQDIVLPEEEQEIAIMFGDLQSFTSISELLSPKETIQMLNDAFDIVTQIVYQNFGDIDKFIGDAFLAVFQHPEMALLSGIAIQSSLRSYNDSLIKKSKPTITFRIGINWGKVIRGSVGGTCRYDNTLIGDPINTAQRLESMSPPGNILVSKTVFSKVECIELEGLDIKAYHLKGKDKEIEAALFYDYYINNPDIMEKLIKIRKEIDKILSERGTN